MSKRKVGFWIEQELYERAQEAADADRRNLSNWLTLAVERTLDEQHGGADSAASAAA